MVPSSKEMLATPRSMTGGGGEVLSSLAGVAGEQAVKSRAVRGTAATTAVRGRFLKGSGKFAVILTRDLLNDCSAATPG
jgi:hypothetical protein